MPRRSSNIKAHPYKDRHGKTRWRVRLGKKQRDVPPPDAPDHKEKVAKAVLDMRLASGGSVQTTASAKYSLAWVIKDFQATSPIWRAHKRKTKTDKTALMKRMTRVWGTYDMRTLSKEKLNELMDGVAADATHNRMKIIWNQLFKHMEKRGWRSDNPAEAIEKRKWKQEHTHIWTDAERQQYRDYWPIGTKQRAAYHLLFDTRQASADVAYMGARNVSDGFITGKRVKTSGVYTIYMSDELIEAVAPFRSLTTYLLTQFGKPYSERGLHNKITDWIGEAGLPDHCTPHGLRGAGLTKDAEAEATQKELMNTGGFDSPDQVQIYIREASRRKLALATHRKRQAGNRKNTSGEP